jgi:hypothetical protein
VVTNHMPSGIVRLDTPNYHNWRWLAFAGLRSAVEPVNTGDLGGNRTSSLTKPNPHDPPNTNSD